MKCAIHQPQFMPWLGYLNKISACDIFVFLDNVQYKKNEYQNRNRIRIGNEAKWITVPVSFKFGDTINQTLIAKDPRWRKKIISSIEHSYSKSPFFEVFIPRLLEIINSDWSNLAGINQATVEWLITCFEIKTRLLVCSELPDFSMDPTGRLIDICRHVGADTYLSGAGAHDYLDMEQFSKSGFNIEFQEYLHPVYQQYYDGRKPVDEFLSHLSALDGLMNCGGGEQGKKMLRL